MEVDRQQRKEVLLSKRKKRLILLCLSIVVLLIGGIGTPLIMRVYFLHGGARKWFSSFLQTAGFPFLLIPLVFSFFRRRDTSSPIISLKPALLVYCTGIGLLTGLIDFLYSYGISFLPVSTYVLLISTQLGFTAVFAFFIVRQKFTASSINAVVLMIFGAVVLGVHSSGDRPVGESKFKYFIGFIVTLAAAVAFGLVMPLIELMYKHTKQEVTFKLFMEIQFIIGFSATIVCTIGMVINKDFEAISREAKIYGLGQTKYYLVIFFTTFMSQLSILGFMGTIKYSSALLSGIMVAICTPITEVFSIFFFNEKFDGEKGVALALSLWGTASYFYGEYNNYKINKTIISEEPPLQAISESTCN